VRQGDRQFPRHYTKRFSGNGVDRVYFLTENRPILALLIYGKNEQSDLSPAQRIVVAALAAEMKQGAGS
jgi:hypothetical protein